LAVREVNGASVLVPAEEGHNERAEVNRICGLFLNVVAAVLALEGL